MFQSDLSQNGSVSPAQVAPQVQCRLEIGMPGDRYEQEVDAVADQVIKMPATPTVQRKCSCEEEQVRRTPLASFIQRKRK